MNTPDDYEMKQNHVEQTVSPSPESGTEAAVLFIVFNRPDTTAKVFETIRAAKPSRLYVAADGPRRDRVGETERCDQVRRIATDVDWPCEVKTLFRPENLGCKHAVGGAIDWLFQHEEKGIILEDDCVPSADFFRFCNVILDRYADDARIATVAGTNHQTGAARGPASYYFSDFVFVWGWATWRRAWNLYDPAISFWKRWSRSREWKNRWSRRTDRLFWEKRIGKAYRGEIDTWDYGWIASVWKNGALTVVPNVNLISNIGFGDEATHTTDESSFKARQPTEKMDRMIHPETVDVDGEADLYSLETFFRTRDERLLNRIKRYTARILRSIR